MLEGDVIAKAGELRIRYTSPLEHCSYPLAGSRFNPCFRRRDLLVIAWRASTLSWPAGAPDDLFGSLRGLDQPCVDGTLRYSLRLGVLGKLAVTFPEVVRP